MIYIEIQKHIEVQINNLYPTIDAYVNFMLGKKNALRYKCI